MSKEIWAIKLDWLNIVQLLGLESISQISEIKKEKAIKRITKLYGTDDLMDAEHSFLDKIVANELRELMKKELGLRAKQEEKQKRDLQNNFMPFKNGGIINIDPRDFKDLDLNGDPQELLKKLAKKFFNADKDDEDDDHNRKNEDSTGYYI